ncbi:hypothetical protein GCM10010343_11590 [Streptomyces avidinii]|nr:hypothetical protein GCM10010343_11590 [Streptomyces avidinii]
MIHPSSRDAWSAWRSHSCATGQGGVGPRGAEVLLGRGVGGITVETRARFGCTAPVGATDDGRARHPYGRTVVVIPPADFLIIPGNRSGPLSVVQESGVFERLTHVTRGGPS